MNPSAYTAEPAGAKPAAAPTAGNPVGGVSGRDDGKLRIVVFGAHPDDAEIRAGGVGAMWAAAGHHVQLVSVTNGDIGHFAMAGGALAKRRTAEVEEASKILGTTATVLDIHDGELEPTLENRRLLTRIIRRWGADIVIGHRPNDYHPDHRYVGVLMQDSAFMVGVPFFCPDAPALAKNPLFLYSQDYFRRRFAAVANQYRDKLVELYGEEAGKQVQFAEAFEICEYGRQPNAQELRRLFPFLPEKK